MGPRDDLESKRSPSRLLALDGFEQGLEVPLAKALRPAPLDDLEEDVWPVLDRLGENLAKGTYFFFHTVIRSSEACWRMPLSARTSSVALSAAWWSKTMISEKRSSKAIVVYLLFVSRSTSTKWRRFFTFTPSTSLTTLENGLSYPLLSACGNIGEVTTTSSSPSKAGRSLRRVTRGLPMTARAADTALPGRSRAEQNSRLAAEKTSGP